MFSFLRSEKDHHFSRSINRERMQKIHDEWISKCEEINQPLSSKVINELKSRVKACPPADNKKHEGGKPKLNFANCEITDDQLRFLLMVLSTRPVISKLDLSSNDISDQVIIYICIILTPFLSHLLELQINQY